jgi:hypothetical protein
VPVRMVLNVIIVVAWFILMVGSLWQIIEHGFGYQSLWASIIFPTGIIGAVITIGVELLRLVPLAKSWVITGVIILVNGMFMIAGGLGEMIKYGFQGEPDSLASILPYAVLFLAGAAIVVIVLLRLVPAAKKRD